MKQTFLIPRHEKNLNQETSVIWKDGLFILFLVLNVFVLCEMTTSKLIFCLLVFTTERHKYFDLFKLSLYFIFCMLIGSPEQRYLLIILLLPNMVK